MGVLFSAIVRHGECLTGKQCSQQLTNVLPQLVQKILVLFLIEQLLSTRWPVIKALGMNVFLDYQNDPHLACEGMTDGAVDWPATREALLDSDWNQADLYSISNKIMGNQERAREECPHGYAAIAVWNIVRSANVKAEAVSPYATVLDELITDRPWQELSGSPWYFFYVLAKWQDSIMRHDLRLDFLPQEMHGTPTGFPQQPLLGPPSADLLEHGGPNVSRAFAGVLRSVLAGVPQTYLLPGGLEVRRLVYLTMVFGPTYNRYIRRFAQRAAAVGIRSLVFFCLDEEAYGICTELPGGPERCVRGTPSILNKFTLPLAFLRLGVDVFWLDFDVFLLQDPTPSVVSLAHRRGVDMLVSGSFGDDCICNGLVFFRAERVVAEWVTTVLSWMYEHVYTHDQQTFSAFQAGRRDEDGITTPESVSLGFLFKEFMEVEVPRWALLDPVTEFPSAFVLETTGWTGDIDRMIAFHMLHGDSEINRDHASFRWTSEHGRKAGARRRLLDVFFGQSDDLVYTDPGPPHQRNEEIREALMDSWRPERPKKLRHCGPFSKDA